MPTKSNKFALAPIYAGTAGDVSNVSAIAITVKDKGVFIMIPAQVGTL